MKRALAIPCLAVLCCALAPGASAGTKLISSWHEPSLTRLDFKKVLVVCFAPHESQRRFGEAELVKLMKKTHGVAAYTVMTEDDIKDEARMRAIMAREGFDGAITMRFVGAGDTMTYQAGLYAPAHSGFWSYYSMAWPLVYDVGYMHIDHKMNMETHVYSLADDKVVWIAITETKNPKTAQKLVNEVAEAVVSNMRKRKLIE
jgi:hypothetical protein